MALAQGSRLKPDWTTAWSHKEWIACDLSGLRIDLISRLLSLSDCIVEFCMVAELRLWSQGRVRKNGLWSERDCGEIKLFPPPTYHGELDKWDDWSWQLKRYVGLYKPLAKLLMDEVELAPTKLITDGLCEAFDVQQTQTQNNQLSLFASNWLTCWHRSLMSCESDCQE